MRWRDAEAQGEIESGICWTGEPDEDVGLYYHACPKWAVDQILAEGLRPGDGRNWPGHLLDWCQGRMFLAAGYSTGEQWRGMLEAETGEPFALLSVLLPTDWERQLRRDERAASEGTCCSYYLTRKIPASFLDVVYLP